MTKTRLLLGGIKSFLPARSAYTMSTAPVDARYGYSVWMRHMAMLNAAGVQGPFPHVVEMGPGNSVATGVCALLSGAATYTGLDVLDHLAVDQAVRVADDVAALFHQRAAIPGNDQYRYLQPDPPSLAFPHAALLAFSGGAPLDANRVVAVRRDIDALVRGTRAGTALRYVFPWREDMIPAGSADLIFSQACLEEILHGTQRSPLRDAFQTMFAWLRPGGVTCHQIDLGMYGLEPWNVHWSWSDITWTLVRGRRDNFVNREPLSTYTALAESVGFEILSTSVRKVHGVPEAALASRFKRLPDVDKTASGVHVILRRPA
jgi:hypothetical protein